MEKDKDTTGRIRVSISDRGYANMEIKIKDERGWIMIFYGIKEQER